MAKFNLVKKWGIVVFALLFVEVGSAQIIFAPTLSYINSSTKTSSGKSELTTTFTDIRLGYMITPNIYLGANYGMINEDAGSSETKSTQFGPSVGFVYNGFNLIMTYHLSGKRDDGTTKYDLQNGLQFDLGYMWNVSSNFSVGPQMSNRSLKYNKVTSGGTTASTDYTRTTIVPSLNLWFNF